MVFRVPSNQVRDLLSIDDEHIDRRLESFLGVPPAPGSVSGTGLLPSMYDQRYRFMRWVYSCTNGIVDLALQLPAVAQYIRDMAPMDPDEAHYTDWIFRFLHRQLDDAEQAQGAISVAEAEVILAKFKEFEIATYVVAGLPRPPPPAHASSHPSVVVLVVGRYGKASPPPPRVLKEIAPQGDHVRMRVEQREDPDEPGSPWLCWTLYNDRNNDINAQLTIHPDPDGASNHHQPEENPVCFRVNSRR